MNKGIEGRTQYLNGNEVSVAHVLTELSQKFGIQTDANLPVRWQIEVIHLVCYQAYHHCADEQVAVQVWRCMLDVRDFLERSGALPRYVTYAFEHLAEGDGTTEKRAVQRIIALSVVPDYELDYVRTPHLVNRLPSAIRAGQSAT